MNSEDIERKSVVQIFNEMNYEEKSVNLQDCGDALKTDERVRQGKKGNGMDFLSELSHTLNLTKKPKSFDLAVESAVKAYNKWKNASASERGNSLYKIWKNLKESSIMSLSKTKNVIWTLVNYFDYYSDLAIQSEDYKPWKPNGVVLVVLSNYSFCLVLGATVSAALACGCSVIVLASEKAQKVCLFLEEIIDEIGLPEGLFNVVTEFDRNDIPVSNKINKAFFYGSYLSAQKYYSRSLAKSFNFLCPNNTAALILESCDINAAVDKIVSETWGKDSLFAVSDIVVQESIHKSFLDKLKHKMEQFMLENENNSKFKDKTLSDKINKITWEALKLGASVEKSSKYGNEWSPTVFVNYQNQDIDEDVPVLKVLLCRTAKEGVTLLNNNRFCLGISIWTEISSQALEISSVLVCSNIWINCHGVFDAGEPLQPSGCSGDCVLGGSDGILEYMSFILDEPVKTNKSSEEKNLNIENAKLLSIAASAKLAFNSWRNMKNRRTYLKNVASSFEDYKEFSNLSKMISNYAHFGNVINFSEKNCTEEFSVIKKKIPIGVILVFLNSSNIAMESLTSLITLPIIMGNAVLLVLREENLSVKLLIKNFNKFLPKNLLNVIVGMKAVFQLAGNPNIQAIWLYEESTISVEFLQTLKNHSERNLKHIWVIPQNISVSQHLFQKECLQNKVVWLTKVDQFP